MKMTVVAMEMAEMAVVECFMLGEGKGVWCYEGGPGQFCTLVGDCDIINIVVDQCYKGRPWCTALSGTKEHGWLGDCCGEVRGGRGYG